MGDGEVLRLGYSTVVGSNCLSGYFGCLDGFW
jgi:hypothetical protein